MTTINKMSQNVSAIALTDKSVFGFRMGPPVSMDPSMSFETYKLGPVIMEKDSMINPAADKVGADMIGSGDRQAGGEKTPAGTEQQCGAREDTTAAPPSSEASRTRRRSRWSDSDSSSEDSLECRSEGLHGNPEGAPVQHAKQQTAAEIYFGIPASDARVLYSVVLVGQTKEVVAAEVMSMALAYKFDPYSKYPVTDTAENLMKMFQALDELGNTVPWRNYFVADCPVTDDEIAAAIKMLVKAKKPATKGGASEPAGKGSGSGKSKGGKSCKRG